MNWKVFKKDDPSTHPEIDTPMVVYRPYTNCFTLDVHYFDNEQKKFYQKEGGNSRWYKAYDECYYFYIGYIPYMEKECHPYKCKGDRCLCAEYDDGYCIGDDIKCNLQEVVTEYALGYKRIWKDFE